MDQIVVLFSLWVGMFAINADGLPEKRINGKWSSWITAGKCSKSSGIGEVIQYRLCNNPAPNEYGKKCDGENFRGIPCISTPCPIDGGWSSWESVGSCSHSCGSGKIFERRVCNNPAPSNGGKQCIGEPVQQITCNIKPCPVDGAWSSWESVGRCSKTCGTGEITQHRRCNQPAPNNGGSKCIGKDIQQIACNIKPCPVDGAWSEWKEFGNCSKLCGSGEVVKVRTCSNPAPANGGDTCIGENVQRTACNTQPCPVEGGWSSWESVGSCSHSCGSGKIFQRRVCNQPAPSNGGQQCIGKDVQQIACNIEPCPVAVDGTWSKWKDYGECSKSCGGGKAVQVRKCNNPSPENGGNICIGEPVQRTACNTQPCSVPKDCTDHYIEGKRVSGVYSIRPDGKTATLVYCDMTDDGGWTVIHRRFNGRTRFWNRGWVEYKKGFGDKEKEYWLGLDTIHHLTRTNKRLKIEMTKYDSAHIYRAEYSNFEVGNECSKYRLTVSGFKGNVRDSMTDYNNNMAFSTYYTDNDRNSGNCASSFKGAWWWKNCGHSNLNGKYSTSRGSSNTVMTWYDGSRWLALQTATMKVRR